VGVAKRIQGGAKINKDNTSSYISERKGTRWLGERLNSWKITSALPDETDHDFHERMKKRRRLPLVRESKLATMGVVQPNLLIQVWRVDYIALRFQDNAPEIMRGTDKEAHTVEARTRERWTA